MTINFLQASLQISSTFIIKPLILYVISGVNEWEGVVDFYDFSGNSALSFLTPAKQYGLSLALIFVTRQAVSFLLSEWV